MTTNRKKKVLSEEHKRNISKAMKGREKGALSEEHIRNMSKALTGRKLSEEHVLNMAKANVKKVYERIIRNPNEVFGVRKMGSKWYISVVVDGKRRNYSHRTQEEAFDAYKKEIIYRYNNYFN